MSNRTRFIALGSVLALLLPGTPAYAAADGSAAIKAAIVYNFTRFAAWRSNRFSGPASPVVVCIAPDHPLAGELAKLDGRPVGDRRLSVRRTAVVNGACHAAVLSSANSSPADLASFSDMGVLTIGEGPGFARSGAIGLVTVGRQVRFEINNKVAAESGVELSSKLLRLAVSVR